MTKSSLTVRTIIQSYHELLTEKDNIIFNLTRELNQAQKLLETYTEMLKMKEQHQNVKGKKE